jgi:Flp pilus assembly pilin Flp
MVEYALVVAVIALVALAGAKLLGDAVNTKFDGEATSVTSGNP